MSLFPAYASTSQTPEVDQSQNNLNWLVNSSFQPETINILNENQEKSTDQLKTTKAKTKEKLKKIKKKKHKRDKRQKNVEIVSDDKFFIDVQKDKRFLRLPFLTKPLVPKYRVKHSIFTYNQFKKVKKCKRYFFNNIENINENLQNENKEFTSTKLEEDLMEKTKFFNQSLEQNPHNIKLWIDYVHFQDIVFQFEKSCKRGSLSKGLRVTTERKVSILDKALSHNPNCEELLRTKLLLAERVYPNDELADMLKKFIDQDLDNIILWQNYIESTQCSLTKCVTSSVLEIYKQCLNNLHQLRRKVTTLDNKQSIENNILNILYQCLLFLRQSGLFEQFWTVLKLYLELNLGENKLNYEMNVNEKDLLDLEQIVFNSNLPSHEIWFRVEKLREALHWLPLNSSCEDPQRLVFADDVSDLVHPITIEENKFKLVMLAIILLKVPLFPLRHTTFSQLGLDFVPWSLDTIEIVLPSIFPLFSNIEYDSSILKDLLVLSVGPQYLKTQPGQEEYLEFVRHQLRSFAENLNTNEKTIVIKQWLSFERLLIKLEHDNVIKLTKKTKVKSLIKNYLKQPENRNNLLIYREYSLIEYEMGNRDNACQILLKSFEIQQNASEQNVQLCLLLRTLIELLIQIDHNKNRLINLIIQFVLNKPMCIDDDRSPTNDDIVLTTNILKSIIDDNLSKSNCLNLIEQFLPDYLIEMILLNGWFLFLTESCSDKKLDLFVDDLLTHRLRDDAFRKELLFEWYINIFEFKYFNNIVSYFKLIDLIMQALELYPNNHYILGALLRVENFKKGVGRPWWKINGTLLNSNYCIPKLFVIFLTNHRIANVKNGNLNAILEKGGAVIEDAGLTNRMLALFKKLCDEDSISKRCGLIWRLYLKFLYHCDTLENCKQIYYMACEHCPWLKALYLDASIYVPSEFSQIQDILIEKELRIHLTPEELEILKS